VLFLFLCGMINADIDISLSDKEWNYVTGRQGDILTKEITIINNGSNTITVDIIPTCDCLFSETEIIHINPQDSKTVKNIFGAKDYSGEVDKKYMIKTYWDENESFFFARGTIIARGSFQE
jgi:hypothetical protein